MNGFTKEAWESASQDTKYELLYGAILYLAKKIEMIQPAYTNQKKECEQKFDAINKKLYIYGILLVLLVCAANAQIEWSSIASIFRMTLR